MTTTLTMPRLGESVSEGEIGKWLVREGQAVQKDQPLVEVLTDKADSELPSPAAGVITHIFAEEGQTVAVGGKLCEIGPATAETSSENGGKKKAATPSTAPSPAAPKETAPAASPAIRKLARERGVALEEVAGTGEGGRITKQDILHATETEPASKPSVRPATPPPPGPPPSRVRGTEPAEARAPTGPRGAFKLPPYTPKPGDEVIPFNRRRRIIADHMTYSVHTSPHVVTFAECDLQKTSSLRDKHKKEYEKEGLGLTFLAFVASASCRALREFRELNARMLDDAYVLLRDINLGIAVDTPEGLVVPVVRNADQLTLRGLAAAVQDLATRARDGRLSPDDLAGKTFTISNPGRKGNLVGGAIISQPNVGILRIGEIRKRVVVVEHDGEDLMAIHPVMHMALSYDHRIVDGVHANSFLWRVRELLELGEFDL